MSKDFGLPPQAAETKTMVENRLREVEAGGALRETLKVEWRAGAVVVDVIDMPVDMLFYNPGTHRVRAQRTHDPVRDAQLDAGPFTKDGQDYLGDLLKAKPDDPAKRDPEFDELKENLKEFGQREPGLITRSGILVNANTRAAALRELGEKYIRVGVLPDTCTWADINAVELSLQLRRDQRRKYSYINELIAMEERLNDGRDMADIAKEFHKRAATVEADLWVLGCLREMLERSELGTHRLQLVDFEDVKEKSSELYRAYQQESKANREKADLLKENRLAGIALKLSKTDLRLIEDNFRERYLDSRLSTELRPEPVRTSERKIPGLGRVVKAQAPAVAEAKAFTDQILQASAVVRSAGPTDTDEVAAAREKLRVIKEEVYDPALRAAGKDARVLKKKLAASDRIDEACEAIKQCVTDVGLARASRTLDTEALDESLLNLRSELLKLAREASRGGSEPGEGLAWLVSAVRQGEA
ncbi:ParB/RepB/Spo0J family partition protein [Streptomyces sp. NPDC050095]|uniref:ParB/RepB/Spo0J family partition protein n=1 Tax=unclassified Streptomyces TaxID=2593676 RepID=UPI00341A4BD0